MKGSIFVLTLGLLMLITFCACAAGQTDSSEAEVEGQAADFVGNWISTFDGDSMEFLFREDGTGYAILSPSSALSKVDLKYSYANGVLTVISYPVGDSANFIDRAEYDAYTNGGFMYIRAKGSASDYHRFSPKE